LLNDLDDAMQYYQINGKKLELEITESSLMDSSEIVQEMLQEIKQREIFISLDDFGTGYSSLAYLTEYPIDILKIDRSFISKIGNPKQEAIVSAMIAMGKAMNLTLVAEGVETQEQADFLNQQKCDILQGFLFSKPLNPEKSTEFLKTHKCVGE
jgi:EAL domain-containing protein (putative c-di-GMP-specific phosphodiesterase class I)